jgi:hypothetical protein
MTPEETKIQYIKIALGVGFVLYFIVWSILELKK